MTTTAYKSSIDLFRCRNPWGPVTTGERIVPDLGDKIHCTCMLVDKEDEMPFFLSGQSEYGKVYILSG